MNEKLHILSLGTTIEPIIKSIEYIKPNFIIFVCSKDSIENISDIKKKLKELSFDINNKYDKVLINNVNNLRECYKDIEKIKVIIKEKKIDNFKISIDYTGGTKTMSVAMGIFAIENRFTMNYITGERDLSNRGIVKTGSETLIESLEPAELMRKKDFNRIQLLFNYYKFQDTIDFIKDIKKSYSNWDLEFLNLIESISKSYMLWDIFKIKESLQEFSQVKKKSVELLKYQDKDNMKYKIVKIISDKLNIDFDYLNNINKKTKNFKIPHITQYFDIFFNAVRRAEEKKYDDAVARLYRSLEILGQIQFYNTFKIKNSNVELNQIKRINVKEYIKKNIHPNKNKNYDIPLYKTFKILDMIKNNIGIKLNTQKELYDNVISFRNLSILAHGYRPIEYHQYEKFYNFLLDICHYKNKIEFLKLDINY